MKKINFIYEGSDQEFLSKKKKKKNKYNKTKILFPYFRSIFIYIIILIFIFILIAFVFFLHKKKKKENQNQELSKIDIIDKMDNQEFNKIKEFIDIIINGQLVNSNTYTENNLTEISVIIPVYNGYSSLRKAILSIQNQDFKNIEIIIIDDKSTDNSVSLVNELIEKDRRIILYQNEVNKGIFFSKFDGISKAKGKYVMILNQNDFYTQANCFSTLYNMAEANKIEVIGFASLIGKSTSIQNNDLNLNHYIETPILYHPDILMEMYKDNLKGTFVKDISSISNYFFRKDIFDVKRFIENIFEKKINYHNNFLLYFLMSRNAYNLKHIKNVFHFRLLNQDNVSPNGISNYNEKIKEEENLKCSSMLYYAQFLLQNTINTKTDRKLASFEINNFLNNGCKNNLNVRGEAKTVFDLFLKDEYIEEDLKNKIQNFLNEMNQL